MNKFAILSVLLMAGMVAATSDIRTSLYASGTTTYMDQAVVFGTDNYHPYNGQYGTYATAAITENVFNTGILQLGSQVTNPGQWNLQEDTVIQGSGTTNIEKAVNWWTVDATLGQDGKLLYPTVTSIYTSFGTSTVTDTQSVYNIANMPPAGPQNYNVLAQQYSTTDAFVYHEDVGINMPLRCVVLPPLPPVAPVCPLCH